MPENKTNEVNENDKASTSKSKKKVKQAILHGNVYILASYNNTIVTVTDPNGDVISWKTAGSSGFKGARKSTPYAAQVAAENAIDQAKLVGFESADIYIKGVGAGREQAIRGIQGRGIDIKMIVDKTPIPFNGCRKKKPRRV